MAIKIQTIKTRKYKAGYEIRDELWENGQDTESGIPPTPMKSAYTPTGDYIGSHKSAYYLCKKRGIKPEKRNPEHCVCSIGFCEREQKWYGWSHRALCGFGIGSKVVKGDCGYKPKTTDEYIEDLEQIYAADKSQVNVRTVCDEYKQEFHTTWDNVDENGNEMPGLLISGVITPLKYIIDSLGKGEWTAETLEDAKQMAKDFAESVS